MPPIVTAARFAPMIPAAGRAVARKIRGAGSAVTSRPITSGLVALGGLAVARPAAEFVGGVASRTSGAGLNQGLQDAMFAPDPYEAQIRLKKAADLRARNEARLAAMDPHLYSQLKAGRNLAPGDVFWGPPRDREALEVVLARMAEGAYLDF